jgi:hypothetical protein
MEQLLDEKGLAALCGVDLKLEGGKEGRWTMTMRLELTSCLFLYDWKLCS